ncbi:MAG: GNAT family N-acetyltransferase [Xanthomonadales bacterium]|nr:GNAT family N-acetyltransferase [Gammaproteobacteria bacterium]NNE04833.1 GNAT family N-acetyltransferase [Xanthomonadales bacterium]NNL94274.1 GNAT family N-acetyltransferase [Xanthomonadales bacterium]
MNSKLTIRAARREDSALILQFIRELAEYERLLHEVTATEQQLAEAIFGPRPFAEVVIAEWDSEAAGFALFFANFSTFLASPGMYLEDLFVRPEFRGEGIGKALLAHLAGIVIRRGWGRLDWSVLDWNRPAIEFYDRIGARHLDDWLQYRLDGPALGEVAGFAAPGGNE